MSEQVNWVQTTTSWEVNCLIRDVAQLQALVKSLETELSEVKKRLEKIEEE